MAAGRLSPDEITSLARQFLDSDLVVRLTPKATAGWEPARWSTVAHRALEDDTLRLLDELAGRPGTPIAEATVAERLRAVGFLGADQCLAVSTSVRAGRIGPCRARPRRVRQDRHGPRRRRLRHR